MYVRVNMNVHTQRFLSGYFAPLRMCSVPMYTHRNTDMYIWICAYAHVYLCLQVWIYLYIRTVLGVGILHSWGRVVCLCVGTEIRICVFKMYVCTCIFMYERVYIHVHVQGSYSRWFALLRMRCMPIHVCMELCTCIFVYVRTCMYIHKCTRKHIRAHTGTLE